MYLRPLTVLALATSASAATLFNSNIPQACSAICQPMSDLTSQCDAGSSSPKANCICTNESFDVSTIGGLCDSCLMQNKAENKELQSLSSTCSFESASYNPSATLLLQGVTVADVNPSATGAFSAGATMSGSMTGSMTTSESMSMSMTMTGSAGMASMTGMDMNAAPRVGVELKVAGLVYLGLLWSLFGF